MDDKAFLLAQAARLRRLAADVIDERAEEALLSLAMEYEERAAVLETDAAAAPIGPVGNP